jgi:hypothetical protein
MKAMCLFTVTGQRQCGKHRGKDATWFRGQRMIFLRFQYEGKLPMVPRLLDRSAARL